MACKVPNSLNQTLTLMTTSDAFDLLRIVGSRRPTLYVSRVSQALGLMESHINVPLSIDELAARLNISGSQLERSFYRTLGMSPRAANRLLRLQKARCLLRFARPLKWVASEAGFGSASHLSLAFKREFGVWPSEERLQLLTRARNRTSAHIRSRVTDETQD